MSGCAGITDCHSGRVVRVHRARNQSAATGRVGQWGACRRWLAATPPDIDKARLSAEAVVRDGKGTADDRRSTRRAYLGRAQ